MSYKIRLARVAYDNISAGNATGRELLKGTNSTELLAKENPVAGSTYRTSDALDHILTAAGGKTTDPVHERLGTP